MTTKIPNMTKTTTASTMTSPLVAPALFGWLSRHLFASRCRVPSRRHATLPSIVAAYVSSSLLVIASHPLAHLAAPALYGCLPCCHVASRCRVPLLRPFAHLVVLAVTIVVALLSSCQQRSLLLHCVQFLQSRRWQRQQQRSWKPQR